MVKAQLEEWIAAHLAYPDGFPYALAEPVISIRERRRLRITPAMKTDYPPVDIEALFGASLRAQVRTPPGDTCPRRFDIDLLLLAKGTVRGDGSYEIAPQSATLGAWWQGREPRS
jgi:hypothetical protein